MSADVEPMPSAGPDAWTGSGDDPHVDIRYGHIRKRFLVLSLAAVSAPLAPVIYVDEGAGYREDRCRHFEAGSSFVFLLDVGRVGRLKSVRIDPADRPCAFRLSLAAFDRREAAEAAVADRLSRDREAKRYELGRLPRIGMAAPANPFRRKAPGIRPYLEACHAAAGTVDVPEQPFPGRTWLSIVVPVYNAPAAHLDDLLASFLAQGIGGTELILSDDASTAPETVDWFASLDRPPNVIIRRQAANQGIAAATNAGLAAAVGDWVTLLDHDDALAPHALRMIARTLLDTPDAAFLYTDEVVTDGSLAPTGLMLKPAYDPVLLSGVNYINHFSIYRHDRLKRIGYLRAGFEGSQDYDLLLRYLGGIREEEVLHLPYPAYLWRRSGNTFSRRFAEQSTAAARRALAECYGGAGRTVTVEPALSGDLHRIRFVRAEEDWPPVTVVIPNRDGFPLISRILADLAERTDYPGLDVVVVDNGTSDPRVLDLYRRYRDEHPSFSAVIETEPFNFSRAVNKGIARAGGGRHILILNNDVEVQDAGWLKEMVSCLAYPRAGIVGARLLYPDGRLQHAGVTVGPGGGAAHRYLRKPGGYGGEMNRLHVRGSVTCVTGAAMLVSSTCAAAVGAWDEARFAVAYNDVDYCLRAHAAGFRTVWTPFATLVHHESASRGSDVALHRRPRFARDKEMLQQVHGTRTFNDPAVSPGHHRDHTKPRLRPPTAAPTARRWWPLPAPD